MSTQFKSVEPRLAPPSRGQHAGAVVLDVLHRRNSVIIRSKRPSGQAGASLALRALRKHKSDARRVGRAALAPHRAPGAQAVRLICFSCGRTRPATICQAPVVSLREAGRNKPWRGTSSSSSSWIRRASHAARAATAQPAHLIALALLMPPTSVACRSSSPGRTSANKCPPPRGRARSTGRRGAAAVCPRLA